VGGSNSYQILELFEESYDPSQSVVVFDAGTNDNPAYPQILAENLSKVAAAIGDRCMVVPTIHGLTVNGIDSSGKNRVVHAFAASRPGTQVPDWAGAVAAHPELLQSDGLHPIPEGADYRAQLIAQGVQADRRGERAGAGIRAGARPGGKVRGAAGLAGTGRRSRGGPRGGGADRRRDAAPLRGPVSAHDRGRQRCLSR
jgi:hypothetical protein